MASLIFNSCLDDTIRGNIDFDTDTFYVMLTTSAYTENQAGHTRRNAVTNEVTGTGYTAGGKVVAVSVVKDDANNKVVVTFGAVTWATATITAAKAVYYKRRGGAASADEIVAVADFGGNVTSTAADFALAASTIAFNNASV